MFDGTRHTRQRMLGQQPEDANVLPHAGHRAMPHLQPGAQFVKDRRQLPLAIHVRVVQSRRPAGQRDQIMHRIKDLIAGVVAATMSGHDRFAIDNLDPVDIRLDGHGAKGDVTRDAVAHFVESHELILVDLRRFANAGVKTRFRQARCVLFLPRESFGNGAGRIA